MRAKAPTSDPASQMLSLLDACLTTQALHVAARLGIAEALKVGPRRTDDVSAALGTQPDALDRLMRTLASIGVLSAGEAGTYQLTPLGETLRTDGPNSVRDWALYIGALAPWTPLRLRQNRHAGLRLGSWHADIRLSRVAPRTCRTL